MSNFVKTFLYSNDPFVYWITYCLKLAGKFPPGYDACTQDVVKVALFGFKLGSFMMILILFLMFIVCIFICLLERIVQPYVPFLRDIFQYQEAKCTALRVYQKTEKFQREMEKIQNIMSENKLWFWERIFPCIALDKHLALFENSKIKTK